MVQMYMVLIAFLNLNSWNVDISIVLITISSLKYGNVDIPMVLLTFMSIHYGNVDISIGFTHIFGGTKWGTKMRYKNLRFPTFSEVKILVYRANTSQGQCWTALMYSFSGKTFECKNLDYGNVDSSLVFIIFFERSLRTCWYFSGFHTI